MTKITYRLLQEQLNNLFAGVDKDTADNLITKEDLEPLQAILEWAKRNVEAHS